MALGVVRLNARNAKSGRKHGGLESLKNTGYLCFGHQSRPSGEFGVRLLCPRWFDIEFARKCITYCKEHHGQACKNKTADPKLTRFFRVIDCQTRRFIIAPQNCKYAALSYVWGVSKQAQTSSTPDKHNETSALDGCPKVISDSIEAAIILNLQYLWVDRFCINQMNALEKHDQISQMNLIYANAEVTIIAATDIPDSGLPGVKDVQRKHQPHLKIGCHLLISTLPKPELVIESSKWATRGWTYQEGLLSKRRLIFTNEQVLFECNGMHCAESFSLPLDKMHDIEKKAFRKQVPVGPLGWKTPGTDPYDIMRYISAFSKRELTFEEDRVNAMRGIFRVFEGGRLPVYQFAGVPILPPVHQPRRNRPYEKLSRSPEEGFLIGLTWSHSKPATRGPSFPSWSWAGWIGETSSSLEFSPFWKTSLLGTKVWIEMEDSSLLPFPGPEGLINLSSKNWLDNQNAIWIEAKSFSCSAVDFIPPGKFRGLSAREEHYIGFRDDLVDGICLQVKWDKPLKEIQLSKETMTGMLIGDANKVIQMAVLFVNEVDGQAERLGVGNFCPSMVQEDRTWTDPGNKYKEQIVELVYPSSEHKEQIVEWVQRNLQRRKIKLG